MSTTSVPSSYVSDIAIKWCRQHLNPSHMWLVLLTSDVNYICTLIICEWCCKQVMSNTGHLYNSSLVAEFTGCHLHLLTCLLLHHVTTNCSLPCNSICFSYLCRIMLHSRVIWHYFSNTEITANFLRATKSFWFLSTTYFFTLNSELFSFPKAKTGHIPLNKFTLYLNENSTLWTAIAHV